MYPESDESSLHFLHPISKISILILSSHLHIGFLSGLFPSGFWTKILYAFLIFPMSAQWYSAGLWAEW